MTGLIWEIPKNILRDTEKVLASKQSEVFVLWTASINTKNVCKISRLVIPLQDTHNGVEGAYVHISGDELSRITFDNFDKNERNVIQIHTHPSEYVDMSPLDRQWEVANHVGALSIIVPSYGRYGLADFSGANIYEREVDDWRLWEKDELKQRFIIK